MSTICFFSIFNQQSVAKCEIYKKRQKKACENKCKLQSIEVFKQHVLHKRAEVGANLM